MRKVIALSIFFSGMAMPVDFAYIRRANGIAHAGTTRMFVGPYEWAPNREPLAMYGAGLHTAQYDHPLITCNATTDVLTTSITDYNGGLPDGTEVKFGISSGGTAPTPLKAWQTDQHQKYYTRDWSAQTFKVALTPGGAAIDITACGSGTLGMSFAGYSTQMSIWASWGRTMTVDTATDILTVSAGHGLTLNTATKVKIMSDDVIPGGLQTFFEGRPTAYCAYPIDTTQFTLRQAEFDTSGCPGFSTHTASTPAALAWTAGTTTGGNPGVRITTAGSWTPFAKQFVTFSSTGTLPSVTIDGVSAPLITGQKYMVDSIGSTCTGNSCFVVLDPVHGRKMPWDGASPGTGTHSVYSRIEDITSSGTGTAYLSVANGTTAIRFANDPVGYPPGTRFAPRFQFAVGGGSSTFSLYLGYGAVDTPSELRGGYVVKVPATTAATTWPITVTLCEASGGSTSSPCSANTKDYTYTLTTQTLTPLSEVGPAKADYTTISGLDEWERMLTSTTSGGGGSSGRCSAAARADPAGVIGDIGYTSVDSNSWFYDGMHNFIKTSIWDYENEARRTGDQADYKICGNYIAHEMARDLNTTPGALGWSYTVTGMEDSLGSSRNPIVRAALLKIAVMAGSGTLVEGTTSEFSQREMSWAFARQYSQEKITGVKNHYLRHYCDTLLSHMTTQAYKDSDRMYTESFFVGLLFDQLHQCLQIFHDKRIPVVVKLMADRVWNELYDLATTHELYYNPEPFGESCRIDCVNITFDALNNYISPIFAFIFRLTGDTTYRDRADELFNHVYDGTYPASPKQYNQTVRYAWNYVEWRLGRKPAY